MAIDLSKSYEFFQPEKVRECIHIVGCGSVGATVAELLVRLGLTNIDLWDMDIVSPHNLANQIFRHRDIGHLKTEALAGILCEIDPSAEENLVLHEEWDEQQMSGYIFLCVDSIELRRKIVEQHLDNPYVKAVFDFRTGLECADHYAADWSNYKMKQALLKSMNYTDKEANEATPVSACGVTLGVAPTVRMICNLGVSNFINFVKGKPLQKTILCNAFGFTLDSFE